MNGVSASGVHVFTVDLEEYFHVEAFADVVSQSRWGNYPSRVESSTRRLLDLLDESQATATFFVLGWLAERHGPLLREISKRGHEIACHSFWHRLTYTLSPREFEADAKLSKDVIEQTVGVRLHGYRAPSFSITRDCLWALDVVAQCGFTYDASIFPIHHDIYGLPAAPRRPFLACGESLTVCPMTTFRFLGKHNWPVGGGAYLRLMPWWYTRMGIARAEQEQIPIIGYVHPWELDPEQPRIQGRSLSLIRHYTNLHKMDRRLRRLLGSGRFCSFRESGLLQSALPTAAHFTGGTATTVRLTEGLV
jgi:polysaccharide deacetylase family protein (PEP-CTERM system associated)